MDAFLMLMDLIFDFLQQPITIWGYTFSLWVVIMFGLMFSLVCLFVDNML